ncbi:unnamed protein product [Caenorhabditis bovis]|uniref:Ubiquitin-like domain-containing protein n=1 Tax=Caenorhabditis bovis TaxID=2654633 RepID=A0A8S1EZU8_9PELO|nr:unnamed protein product [Caenorhabditis bovis]
MELSLILNLQDHEGSSHRKKPLKFDKETSVEQLSKAINSLWNIDEKYQELFFNGQQILSLKSTLQDIGVKDDDEIVVCHTMLINWRTYIQMINEIKRMTTSGVTDQRREIALKARIQLSPLYSSNFFGVYPSLAIEEVNIGKSLNFLIHNTKKYLHRSVSAYFQTAYPGKTVELKNKSEEFAGVHLGVFVFIDNEPSYYAKTLGSVPGPDE